jgi:hypothetical protein
LPKTRDHSLDIRITSLKTNKKIYEIQFPINPTLKDEIEKKNNSSQTKLIGQNHDMGYMTRIIS